MLGVAQVCKSRTYSAYLYRVNVNLMRFIHPFVYHLSVQNMAHLVNIVCFHQQGLVVYSELLLVLGTHSRWRFVRFFMVLHCNSMFGCPFRWRIADSFMAFAWGIQREVVRDSFARGFVQWCSPSLQGSPQTIGKWQMIKQNGHSQCSAHHPWGWFPLSVPLLDISLRPN